MKKDIFIIGSTGSIGITTLNVVRKNKKKINIKLLTTNTNINKIYEQAIEFNVKNIVIFDKYNREKYFEKFKKKKIKVFATINEVFKSKKKNHS